ncbi:LysR family transcriptional regulator [Hoeflea ulvae]|uniref:LysR family transcriptional regulator n=1 Tax=Hoeflea ulvae TaxID=2983764 RepID=A0ABT3YLG4_9HYPH|nr:LysR family transcriptional regulator [Hoeflea ulvae]MCY0096740.1 LysR family transcriptional regulator [Hoeflea ulvae]
MDTLLSLRVLAAVAEQKSFAAVAERLGLSPAMTSKHVQHVEARIGARLLNRNSRNVSLTEAGARYLATVRPLIEGLDEAEAQLSETSVAPRGVLKVSAPVWVTNPAFARIIAAYRLEYPEVTLDFDLSGRMVNLVEEGLDLALRVTDTLGEGLIARKLAEVHFPLIASPDFLESYGRPASVVDLTGAPFLTYTPMAAGGRLRYGEGADAIDIRFKPVLLSGNETLILMGAREGMGFAFMPHWLVTDDIAEGRLELVLPDTAWPRVPLRAIYPDRSYLPAKVRSFLDFLAGPKGLGTIRPLS